MKAMLKFGLMLILFSLLLSACSGAATPTPTPPATIPPAVTQTSPATTPAPTPTPAAAASVTPVLTSGQPVELLRIDMIDPLQGWAVGVLPGEQFERVLRTIDGGQTWRDVTPYARRVDSRATNTSVRTAFHGAQNAWALYYASFPAPSSDAFFIYHTADGGVSWGAGEVLDLNGLMMDFFLPGELGFSDENNGWLLAHLGAGMNHDYVAIFKTSDAGQTWARVVEPPQGEETANALPMSCVKTGLTFLDAQTGWVAGNCQGVVAGVYLYQTRDGGASWRPVELPAPDQGQAVWQNESSACGANEPIFQNQTGYLDVGCMLADGSNQRYLYRSADGGETWNAVQAPSTFGGLTLTPAGILILLGWDAPAGVKTRTLFTSPDEGQSWKVRLADIAWSGALDFVDGQNGWARVVQEDETTRLLRTRDGGQTWEALSPVLVP